MADTKHPADVLADDRHFAEETGVLRSWSVSAKRLLRTIPALEAERDAAIAARDGYIAQHHRDSAELRQLCAERDELRWQVGRMTTERDQLRAKAEALKRRAALDELARIDQDIAAAPKPCRCGPDGCADSACPGRDINRHQIAFDRRMAAITTKPEDRT